MRIANPIYDVVFKYLLEDNQVAKLLLSTLLGEEIVELIPRPQEHSAKLSSPDLSVYRLDFSAHIQNSQGEHRHVIIEIQKAKLASDVMRFRRYLGEQYLNKKNVEPGLLHPPKPLPIVTVYFLGYALDNFSVPVIRVRREYYDLGTGQRLVGKEKFIESLTHDSYIIQIPFLSSPHRTEVEAMLQIFDQKRVSNNKHFLELEEDEILPPYRSFVKRLYRAIVESELEEIMVIEDEISEEILNWERKVANEQQARAHVEIQLTHVAEQLTQERVERQKAESLAQQAETLAHQAEAEKNQERVEKERERAEKERLLEILKQAGISINHP